MQIYSGMNDFCKKDWLYVHFRSSLFVIGKRKKTNRIFHFCTTMANQPMDSAKRVMEILERASKTKETDTTAPATTDKVAVEEPPKPHPPKKAKPSRGGGPQASFEPINMQRVQSYRTHLNHQRSKRKPNPDAKPRRRHPGTRAKDEGEFLRRQIGFMCAKKPFAKMVRKIMAEQVENLGMADGPARMQPAAIEILQVVAEAKMHEYFESLAMLAGKVSRRATVNPVHLHVAHRLMEGEWLSNSQSVLKSLSVEQKKKR